MLWPKTFSIKINMISALKMKSLFHFQKGLGTMYNKIEFFASLVFLLIEAPIINLYSFKMLFIHFKTTLNITFVSKRA